MKYMSLFALCSMLVLIPGCGKDNGCGTRYCPTTTVVESNGVEVQAEEVVTERQTIAVGEDKESLLEEAELVEVMGNK